MNKLGVCVLIILLNLTVLVRCECGHEYSRHDFPSGFVFGSATSAYQVEGAASEDGRGSSIWDTFAHSEYANGASGDVAVDQYHKYKEDVKLMAEMGLDAYRFSISWSRLIPNGRGAVNPKGVKYYNNLINELLTHGIKPHVTLNHADLPQALEDEYEGWINSRIVMGLNLVTPLGMNLWYKEDFTAYADVCFREFGDRVLYWITVNEPNIYAIGGYDQGMIPPSRCSGNCGKGNSSSEPYIVVHNILLAHASAATLYKTKYQEKHKGFIGISVYTIGFIPDTNSREDVMAAQRTYDFYIGWVMNPLVFGDYPYIMKKLVGSRLPSFSNHESQLVRGSFDFFGVIHYTTCRVQDDPGSLVMEQRNFARDMAAKIVGYEEFFTNSEYPIVPWGLQAVLEHIKQVYGNPPVYIVENGQKSKRNSTLEDTSRVEYLQAYIGSLVNAIRNGSDTRGYFAWSLLDVLEILDGYKSGFGLFYVDLNDPYLNRQPKLSAYWYSHFLKGGTRSVCLNNNFSTLDH